MRTTLNLDDDVAAEVARIRRDEGLGLSEALNRLARRGLAAPDATYEFRQETRDLGARIDVANIAEVLELLDETDA
ncbi:MAG: CopG family transcriptional regulator [Nocardioides sp.]